MALSKYLDKTGMYMVALQMLGLLYLAVLVTSVTGILAYPIWDIIVSTIVILIATLATSILCALATKVNAQHPSSFITGLIIFFIVTPGTDTTSLMTLIGASVLAVASKYVLVYHKQHVANPVAIGIVILSLLGLGGASWWVATPVLFIPLLIAGALLVTKIRKWPMVLAFVTAGFIVFLFEEWRFGSNLTETWSQFFLSYPTLFLAFFMLTEPFTTPSTKKLQIGYAVVVAFLANTALLSDLFKMTPELALVIGNVAFFATGLKQKLFLKLLSRREIAPLIFEFTFTKPAGMQFKAGQYLEWMLPHTKTDSRGIRRYFTIASAPSEDVLRLALKIPQGGSAYKKALAELPIGGEVIASQLSGDFMLPSDSTTKIGWIAGGIGITPFRSQLQNIADKNEVRDITLFYGNNTIAEAAYGELFAKLGARIGLKTVYVFAKEPASSEYETGYFSAEIVKRHLSDYAERVWYISGPPMMVNSAQSVLRSLGVPRKNIKKDFFPGLA